MVSKIIDKATDEISAVIGILWDEKELKQGQSYEDYAKQINDNVDWLKVKDHLDHAQELLLNLMIDLEDFEKSLILKFWECAREPNSTLKSMR